MGLNKDQCLTLEVPLFLPGNKILINIENDDNSETTDNPQSEKMIRHILVEIILLQN